MICIILLINNVIFVLCQKKIIIAGKNYKISKEKRWESCYPLDKQAGYTIFLNQGAALKNHAQCFP